MKTKRKYLLQTLVLYSPVILGWILMIPRLLSPQFGFFDDATTITTSENILNGSWSLADEAYHGRFRPVYWMYYALIYAFAGQNPFWFFMGNALLLSLLTVGIIRLTSALGFNRFQAWFAGMLYVLAGSTLENIYTLSKPELQQSLWLVLSLLTIGLFTPAASKRKKLLALALASTMIFLSCACKETSLIILPIAVAWFLTIWFLRLINKLPDETQFPKRRAYMFAALLGVVAFLILRWLNLPSGLIESGYPSRFDFSLARVTENTRIWLDLLMRDYLYLIPLALSPILWWLLRREFQTLHRIFEIGIWMLAWTMIYLPWQFTQEYYLLPFALGAAILAGLLLGENFTLLQQNMVRWRALSGMGLAFASIFFLLTTPSYITKARAQLAIDASNDEMLTHVLENAPQDSVLLINIQEPNEYVGNFITLVQDIGERSDLAVDYFQFQDPVLEGWEGKVITIVSPIVENQFYPSMRMGIFEMPSRTWNQSLLDYLGNQGVLVFQTKQAFRSSLLDTPRAFCFAAPSLTYCQKPHSPLDNRVFGYGWDIYRLEPPPDG
jgi:hypothetical protein